MEVVNDKKCCHKSFPRFAIITREENMAIDFQEGNCNLLENNTRAQISMEKYFTLLLLEEEDDCVTMTVMMVMKFPFSLQVDMHSYLKKLYLISLKKEEEKGSLQKCIIHF